MNIETGAVGSGEGAWLLSVPRSSVHWVRVGQRSAVLAVNMGGCCLHIFSLLCRYDVSISLQNSSIKTEIMPQRTILTFSGYFQLTGNSHFNVFSLFPVNWK